MKKFLLLLLTLTLILGTFTSCNNGKSNDPDNTTSAETTEETLSSIKTKDLMSNITPKSVSPKASIEQENLAAMDFAIELFKEAEENGKNTLISPLSVLCALAMTANGADNETLEQMEEVLGMSTSELNLYLYTYINSLPQSEKCKFNLANSIWFTDDDSFTVNEEFLQTNADYYGADIYKSPFDDRTVKDINAWANDKTNGYIPQIIEHIPKNTVMYLINALTFDAFWSNQYDAYETKEQIFTAADGSQRKVKFMHANEVKYIEDADTKGFMKYYQGFKYAFVALLPDASISLSDYISTLDGEKVSNLISNTQSIRVKTAVPRFEVQYENDLIPILQNMGITDAFDYSTADFSELGKSQSGNIFISEVLHKTCIQMGEKGTKANAVVLEALPSVSEPTPTQKSVYLNRPFVYMIIDCENNIPLFIGALNDVE